ncbi:unnamed protein product, partial [Adineta steineri]
LNVTEDQCICEMIKVNDSISALNYFSTNQTCQLYRSNSSTIYVEFYLNSTIIFLNQSSISILNILEYQPSTTSSTPTAISSSTTSACNFFLNQTTYSVGTKPLAVAVADVNNDNKPDIIVANYGSNTVSVLLNAGNGTFSAQTTYPVGTNPYSVVVVDVNNDNKPDIVVANAGSNSVGVLLNAGNGTFNAQTTYTVGTNPWSVAVFDVNSDNKPDIIVANFGSPYTVSVLLHC